MTTNKLYSFRIHRNRPVVAALDHAARWLGMDTVSGVLFTIREYGIRGQLAIERRAIRASGWRQYLRNNAGWLAQDIQTASAMTVARLLGRQGAHWLIVGMIDAHVSIAANEGLIRASDVLRQEIDAAYAAQVAEWKAERKAKQDADYQAWLNAPRPEYPADIEAAFQTITDWMKGSRPHSESSTA